MLRIFLVAAISLVSFGQVLDNKSLSGKYNFRELSIASDLSEVRSLSGSVTFDGNGGFTLTGQQLVGAMAVTTVNGSGVYTVQSGGLATLSDPLRTGSTLNARVGSATLVASDSDLFSILVAMPAPTTPLTAAALNGSYWVATLEIPNGNLALIRETLFKLTSNGSGSLGNVAITGEAANLQNRSMTQTAAGSTYTIASDGTGSANFPVTAGGDPTLQLLAGVKSIALSQDGSMFLGGSTTAGGHGLVIGVRSGASLSNGSVTGLYWGAGLRGENQRFSSFVGSANSPGGNGNLIWYRRLRTPDGLSDVTALNKYMVAADGSGTALDQNIAVAASGQIFLGSGLAASDTTVYQLYVGVRAPTVSGTGVFLNPQGVVNAASFAPAGNPVSPGELITLFGTGLAAQTATATRLPFPATLGNVQVLVNSVAAPVYSVSSGQISALVPFGVTGSVATFVVNNNGTHSNSVDVPLSASSPGVFSIPQSGIGQAAILHVDFSLVGPNSPARYGETVQIFLTGLGSVTPPIADGSAAPANPLSVTKAPLAVFIGDSQGTITFQGLAPGLAGLYQINVMLPASGPAGTLALGIQTSEGFTDLADISVSN